MHAYRGGVLEMNAFDEIAAEGLWDESETGKVR